MATNGMIGRSVEGGVDGVGHHFDSYPTALGKSLWDAYHEHFGRDIEKMTSFLVDGHPAGWSTINGADLSAEPGYGSPSGPACYCHGQRDEEANPFSCRCAVEGSDTEGCDPLFIEWVYGLSAAGMDIWFSRNVGGGFGDGYRHISYGMVPWDGPEPDWEKIEHARYPEDDE